MTKKKIPARVQFDINPRQLKVFDRLIEDKYATRSEAIRCAMSLFIILIEAKKREAKIHIAVQEKDGSVQKIIPLV